MGKNGGEPTDTILTLEEALKQFKRKITEVGVERKDEIETGANVHGADSPAATKLAGGESAVSELGSADQGASASDQRDDAGAEILASNDIVAVIDGIPRTMEQLEQLAAADKAYAADFPETVYEDAGLDDDDDLEPPEIDVGMIASRHSLVRDYAFTAMGTALMVLVAVLATRVPTMNNEQNLVAQSVPTPALKASSLINVADDLFSTLVIVPDTDTQTAAHNVKPAQLEARIKDTLKLRAFPDIGVSVSKQGDAYLAGEVYSLNEARRITQIVHRVNGVNGVHFLHPDVRQAQGPAFFGVTTASAPSVWGAKVKAVLIGSPADKAGLKSGDVISEFDGNTIPDGKALNDLIAQYSPGERVQFRVWHDGRPEYLLARLSDVQTVASR
jgi:PDZ domain/BON domain